MNYELELTKANRLKVARAFRFSKRVDFSIECAIEGQLGKVLVDDLAQPTAYCLRVGPFGYFAGEARTPRASGSSGAVCSSNTIWVKRSVDWIVSRGPAFERFRAR